MNDETTKIGYIMACSHCGYHNKKELSPNYKFHLINCKSCKTNFTFKIDDSDETFYSITEKVKQLDKKFPYFERFYENVRANCSETGHNGKISFKWDDKGLLFSKTGTLKGSVQTDFEAKVLFPINMSDRFYDIIERAYEYFIVQGKDL